MNASMLRREIEILLGLAGTQAADLWRAASSGQGARHGTGDGGYVLTSVQHNARANLAPKRTVTVEGTGSRFDGKYFVTGVQHKYGKSGYKDLFECVRAAAADDEAALRIWPLWVNVKREIGKQPAHVRHQLGHELVHTVQQRGK
jgi:hypothetical protein